MEINYIVPFFENTPDDTHCFQAALKMILKYFQPDKDFSWDELEKATAKKEGMWTWPMAGLIWMQKQRFEVVNMEVFDYGKFIELGKRYMEKEYGKEVAEINAKWTDIPQEQEISKEFLKVVETRRIIPIAENIKQFLRDGYLVICNLNSRVINQQAGYAGHSVVVKGFDEVGFSIHDPGLPGLESRKVEYALFEKAWAYPNEKAKNIMAFRLRN